MTAGFADHPGRPIVESFWRLAERAHAAESYDDTYRLMSSTAVEDIAGCDAASVSTLGPSGPVSHGIVGTLAEQADQVLFEEGEGPCLDTGMREGWIYTPDLARDRRWPSASQRLARELAVRSMFSCRLATDGPHGSTLGGIGLYSLSRDAFTEADQLLAVLLCALGTLLVGAARQQANLQAAIATRQVIGEAIGILRSQRPLTSEQAFQLLVAASMRTNVKLRDVARQVAGRGPVP
jgi:hypothetical protein